MCPISPAAPFFPLISLPSAIIPPPIPVPIATPSTFLCPFPAPFHISPRVITLTSLSTLTFLPRCFSNSDAKSTSLGHGKLAQNLTVFSPTTGPGTPIPIPWTSSILICASFICSSNIFDNLAIVFS